MMMAHSLWLAHRAPRGQRQSSRLLLEWCRQSGKNELAAAWDCSWLHTAPSWIRAGLLDLPLRPGGLPPSWEAVHSAPTYRPGIAVAKRRLETYLDGLSARMGRREWVKEDGICYRPCRSAPAGLTLVSAGETATRRGLTANAYLRVDEVQHTSSDVYGAELSPMCSSTGAFQIFQGTRWTEDSLGTKLGHQLEDEQRKLGRRLVLRVPWTVVAEVNEAYGLHVQREMERLGPGHPIIQSEYELVTPEAVGALLNREDIDQLHGDHRRLEQPVPGRVYVGGVDFCGAAEEPDDTALDPDWVSRRDNTCAVIGELVFRETRDPDTGNTVRLPVVRVVDARLWPGQQPETIVNKLEQYLFSTWRCSQVWLDGRGVGDGPSAMLHNRRRSATNILKSTVADVTRMGLRLLGAVRSGRLSWWHEEAPGELHEEAHRQFRHLRKEARDGGQFRWGHPPRRVDGKPIHDDIPKAVGYMLEAAYEHLSRHGSQPKRRHVPWDEAAGYE